MNYYKDYYKTIDLIRSSRHVSVSDLCDGIISERTYYRHLHSNGDNINIKTFGKLVNRLNVNITQIVYWSFFLKKDDPGILKFIFRVHIRHFDDIDQYYQNLKSYCDDDMYVDLLIKSYLLKYEYITHKISKSDCVDKLKKEIQKNDKIDLTNIYYLSSQILYFEVCDLSTSDINNIAGQLLKHNYYMQPLLSLVSIDVFLSRVVGSNLINEKTLIALINRLKEILNFFPNQGFHMNGEMYLAYSCLLSNKIKEMNQHLLRCGMYVKALTKGEWYQYNKERIEKLFNISFNDFLVENFKRSLNSSMLNIKLVSNK